MQMKSPKTYSEEKKHYSIEELENEKNKLIENIKDLNDAINNGIPDIFGGGRYTKLKMLEEYLLEIEKLIQEKTNI